ncbi:AAA family ATPase [Mucilaginibacter angelicae]|uniref:AAA family ATPase n=1 Tax=Mucilaginibacter angelicae TaxID=869718 RepID=A0ABV6L4W0_9SPHI
MAKVKATATEEVLLDSGNPSINSPRLTKLIIKNFRAIGSKPVAIDLNDIVVPVGGNNVGKSTILKAYEIAMCQGSNSGILSIDDFPRGAVNLDELLEIEI